tara:strand:- start:138 stop:863 length:726 start_codon:yes stop_codon:yes gene_type:complete
MKKYLITYGTNKYYYSKFRLENEVKRLNTFDEIILFDKSKLSKEFKETYAEVLNLEHGDGFWIWKFDIIKQKLDKINDGDYLVYLDAGCAINLEGKERLNEYFEMLNNSDYGIISFEQRFRESDWTTKKIFDYFNIKYDSNMGKSGQYWGGALIMQKKSHTIKIIDEVFKVLNNDMKLFTNEYGSLNDKTNQHPGFKDNRHDQSILSLVRKIHGSIELKDETLSHLPESKKWPIWAKRYKG